MDWTASDEGVRAQLMRIVALLLGLGTLAQRAAHAPFHVRMSVIGLLRPAEAVAWEFVAGEAAMPEPAGEDEDQATAMLLATRFRALAIMLAAFADRLGGNGTVRIGLSPAVFATADVTVRRCPARPFPFDTS